MCMCVRFDSKLSDFSSLLLRFVGFSRSIVIPMCDVLCLDTQHIQQKICKLFVRCSRIFALSPIKSCKNTHSHVRTLDNSHGHTHAHTDFSRFTCPNHLYLFSKITSWTNFFSHTLSFLFFSSRLFLFAVVVIVGGASECVQMCFH